MPWYEELFDERYLAFYREAFEAGASANEIDFIDRVLALPAGASILDLGAGFGRHAIPLAERGYRVTGLDASQHLLEVARKMASTLGVEVRWVHGDMRELGGLEPLDACVCLYTVFGYFEDDDNARVLLQIHSALRPGGRLLLHLDNPIPFVGHLPDEHWSEAKNGVRRERHRYDALHARVVSERILFGFDGTRIELPESSVRLYAPHELARLFSDAGFEVEQVHGGLSDAAVDWRRSSMQSWLVRRR